MASQDAHLEFYFSTFIGSKYAGSTPPLDPARMSSQLIMEADGPLKHPPPPSRNSKIYSAVYKSLLHKVTR